MPTQFLGIAVSGLVALVLLLVGFLSLTKMGAGLRGLTSWIPIGNYKLWAIVLIIFGFSFGGLAYGISSAQGLFSGASTASGLGSGSDDSGLVSALSLSDCQIATIGAATSTVYGNITFRADPNDNTHYFVDLTNVTNSGAGSLNGTITCSRDTQDIRQGQAVDCYVKAGTFTNKQSSTDPALYRMVALSAGASKVDGIPSGFKQTAYLQSAAIATTSSPSEKTKYTFAQDTTSQTLGFYITLPGATNVNYLNVQDSVDNVIVCGDKTVAKLTITKLAA
ncbi:MAG: hypothetical protein WC933_03130 [Candidatus Paceibacterota bacterium]|jgi:hypothetical protein